MLADPRSSLNDTNIRVIGVIRCCQEPSPIRNPPPALRRPPTRTLFFRHRDHRSPQRKPAPPSGLSLITYHLSLLPFPGPRPASALSLAVLRFPSSTLPPLRLLPATINSLREWIGLVDPEIHAPPARLGIG
jgi:hypothetical protein